MKSILFAAFVALIFFSQHSHAQFICFEAGTITAEIPGGENCALFTVVQAQQPGGQAVGVVADLTQNQNGLQVPFNFPVAASLGGDLGQPINDGTAITSQQCQNAYQLRINTIYQPGAHTVNAHFNRCDQYGPAHFDAQVTIYVQAPIPSATPPCGATLIDPVRSNLVRGSAITTNPALLGNPSNTTAAGVSADGVAELVVGIPTQNVGDSVQVTVINDANSPSVSSDQDGGLFKPEDNVSSLANNVSIVAKDTPSGPTAFAIYRTPTNFARGSQSYPLDYTTNLRLVKLQTICLPSGGQPSDPKSAVVEVFRPPVILVHGLWSNPRDAWSNFVPVTPQNITLWGENALSVQNPANSLEKYPINYSGSVNNVTSTVPSYSWSPSTVSGSALGFSFNAPNVLSQTQGAIASFAGGHNIAAVQADVVAHSMGGDISRAIVVVSNFLTQNNYGLGPVHKLITIGTPHLGTPLAGMLLPSGGQDPNGCVRAMLAHISDKYSFQSVTIGSNPPVSGAVGDLSAAPSNLPATEPFPVAYLAGSTNPGNLSGVGHNVSGSVLSITCGDFNDPLALDLQPPSWNNVFGGVANDGIVPVTSQLNSPIVTSSAANTFPGVIHSPGILDLGFSPPSELDPSSGIPDAVVNLLNEAPNGSDFH